MKAAELSPSVVSINIGRVTEIPYRDKTLATGIRKSPVAGPCELHLAGVVGDEQGDKVNHGGRDKAVCAYPSEHYPYWTKRLDRELPVAAFGENLTLLGLTEDRACIGDVYALGTAVIQLSQPRQPCYRLAASHGVPELAQWVQDVGYTGFYFRVLSAGAIELGAELVLEDRFHPDLTVVEANRVMHHDRDDRAAMERLLVPELSERWQRTLRRRLHDGGIDETAARLTGT